MPWPCIPITSLHLTALPGHDGAAAPRRLLTRRVKDYCIARGFSWVASTAHTVCSEADYYEDLLRAYRANKRVRGGSGMRVRVAFWVEGCRPVSGGRAALIVNRTHSRPRLLAPASPPPRRRSSSRITWASTCAARCAPPPSATTRRCWWTR